jgi:hypothetical protein
MTLEDLLIAFLAFFLGVGLAVAFHLLARVLDAPALDAAEGSSMALPPGERAEMGMAEIGMSPLKLGMGEMKLSKSCIRTIKTSDLKKTEKTKLNKAPYRVPFYSDMVGTHLFIGWPVGSLLEYFSQMFQQELRTYLFLGLLSRVLGSIVLPTQIDLFLQRLDSTGQPTCGHADSCQDLFLQWADLVSQGSNLGELEWSRLFTPSSLELREPAYEWREAGFMVLAIEPCPVPSPKRGFQGKIEEASVRVSLKTYAPTNLSGHGTQLIL